MEFPRGGDKTDKREEISKGRLPLFRKFLLSQRSLKRGGKRFALKGGGNSLRFQKMDARGARLSQKKKRNPLGGVGKLWRTLFGRRAQAYWGKMVNGERRRKSEGNPQVDLGAKGNE